MTPFDAYRTYLSLKNHFTKPNYDYIKYAGKTRASIDSFNKRKDKYWFEKLSRQKNDDEIKNFFISNFVECTDPASLWIGQLIREGESVFNSHTKRIQSMRYVFKEQSDDMFSEYNIKELFDCSRQHPPILKKFLSGNISIEFLVIFEKIFCFTENFDKKLKDPVWESVSFKIKKYSPFLNIDIQDYKNILKKIVLEE